MAKAEMDYTKHYQEVFRSKVMPAVKQEIEGVTMAKNKLESLTQRFQQNQEELTALANDLLSVRSKSVEHVMSQKKSEEYIQEISGIKNRISLLTDAQEEIKTHLLPNIESQLQTAYTALVRVCNAELLKISNQVKNEVFNVVEKENKKGQGFHQALLAFNEDLHLPIRHCVNIDDGPYFNDLDGFISKGRWWEKRLLN